MNPAGLRAVFLADRLVVGGAERVFEALVMGLPALGIETRLGLLREPGAIGHSLRERGCEVRTGLAPRRYDPLQIHRVRNYLRQQRADIVYVLDHSNALFYGRLAAASLSIPQVCAVHRTRRADGSPSLGAVDRWGMRFSDAVIAVSEGQARYLRDEQRIGVDRIEVVYNGIDARRFDTAGVDAGAAARRAFRLPAEVPLLGVVAALRPEKNHELLLGALATEALGGVHVVLAGTGEREPFLRDFARERGVADRVHWLGAVSRVEELMPALDILVLPSHPAVETFPLCVLEAMAAERPVVATAVGSLDEMVDSGRTGLLVPAGDLEAMAAAIAGLIGDPARRRAMGKAGRARVGSAFTEDLMVDRTADLLRRLTGRERG